MKTAQKHPSKRINLLVMTLGFLAVGVVAPRVTGVLAQEDNPFMGLSDSYLESSTQNDPENATVEAMPVMAFDDEVLDSMPALDSSSTQSTVSLTAIPPRLGDDNTLKALPGEKLQVQVRVRNLSEESLDVVTSVKDFIISDDGSTPVPIDDSTSNRWSLASWLTITPTENVIGPNETVGLNVLIEVPEDALPGGHYAMILHEPGNGSGSQLGGQSQSAISQKVGTLLYVIVDGDINEEAYVRNFKFPSFTEYGPVPFSYTVENASDVHISPVVSIEIYNIFNQLTDKIVVNSKNIFPLDNRDFDGQWDRIWGFGPYKAKLVMSFGTKGTVVFANTSFWLLPIKLLIALLVGILIFVILVLAIKRHLNHRRDMDKNRIAELEGQLKEMKNGSEMTSEPISGPAPESEGGGQDDTPQA